MSSIASSSAISSLSVLTGPNGPLSKLPFAIPQSVLQKASPTDLAEISVEAQKLADANILFGVSEGNVLGGGPSNIDSALSLLGSIYGVASPSASDSSTSASPSITSLPFGSSASDQYLLSATGSDAQSGSLKNVTG